MVDENGAIEVGDQVPDVELIAPSGETERLSTLIDGHALVIAFYPKDFTPICHLETRRFRDAYDQFAELGAEVIGISSDPPESHRKFAAKNDIPYNLYTDPEGHMREVFGVPRTLGIIPGRVTYVVDSDGVVRNVYSAQLAAGKHVAESLKALEEMQAEDESG
jgi:peroxiredoxin Q/BCP